MTVDAPPRTDPRSIGVPEVDDVGVVTRYVRDPPSCPAAPWREGKREVSTFSRAGAGVPPLAREGTAAAGPHRPHGASVKVSDASASADVEVGEERVRLRGEQVSPRLLRDCFCPLVISRLASSRDCCDITEPFGLMNGDTHSGGLQDKTYPSARFVQIYTLPLARGDLFATSLHRNDAR